MSPNNLQHFIDQHPTLFVGISPVYFITIWLLVCAVISCVGGWHSLAKVYRTRVPFNGAKWSLNGWNNPPPTPLVRWIRLHNG